MSIDHSNTELQRLRLIWSFSLSEHEVIDKIFARLESVFNDNNTCLSSGVREIAFVVGDDDSSPASILRIARMISHFATLSQSL